MACERWWVWASQPDYQNRRYDFDRPFKMSPRTTTLLVIRTRRNRDEGNLSECSACAWAMPYRSRPANLLHDADIIISLIRATIRLEIPTATLTTTSATRQRIKSRKVKTKGARVVQRVFRRLRHRLLPVAVPTRARLWNSNSITTSARTWQPGAASAGVSEWMRVASWILIKHFRHTLGAAVSGKFWNVGRLSCYIIASGHLRKHLHLHLHLRKRYFVCNNWIYFDEWYNIVEPAGVSKISSL